MKDFEEDVFDDFEKAKVLVVDLLEKDLRCRNDDVWLCFQVWKSQGIKIEFNESDIPLMFSPSTIIRNRSFIQNEECRLLPTDPMILFRRKMKESAIRSYYGNNQRLINEWQNLKYQIS
ncbi:MAG: hypothetical protein Q7R52_02510 [archaeon]|nr:hypothetical protein [archaeon]